MEVVLVYGRGWGPVHQMASLPASLEPTQLVARCGLAATIRDPDCVPDFTCVQPLGLFGTAAGQPLNLGDFPLDRLQDN